MKLLVLGATGGTGLEIVGQAIERGHQVTAFVRNPERLKAFGDAINVIRGDCSTVPSWNGRFEVRKRSYPDSAQGTRYQKRKGTFCNASQSH